MSSLTIGPVRNNPDKIQLTRLGHVYLSHPDLAKWGAFAKDFGFEIVSQTDQEIYCSGYGKDPYVCVSSQSPDSEKHFNGGAFVAKTEQDFEKATKLPNASLQDLSERPGGGKMVSIPSPSGPLIHVVFGQVEKESAGKPVSATHVSTGEFNHSLTKGRKGIVLFVYFVFSDLC